MNESQLVRSIKAHISKGTQLGAKSEQHYISAGLHLKTLKAQHGGNWAQWEKLLREKIGIGKSRASELMQIADGRKTNDEVRAETSHRAQEHRGRLRYNGESRAVAVVEPEPNPTDDENRVLAPLTKAEIQAVESRAQANARERDLHDERNRLIAERLAKKLIKTDIKSAHALYEILDSYDPHLIHALRKALERDLGGDGDTGRTEAQKTDDIDPFDIPPMLDRIGATS